MHSDSVYQLVHELVESIGLQHHSEEAVKVAKKCKCRAFGILLGKQECTATATQSAPTPDNDASDPLSMLECYLFEQQITSRYQYQMLRNERFEILLDQIRNFPDKNVKLAQADRVLLQFLLSLKNSVADCADIHTETPFFGHSKMPAARYGPYPLFHDEDFHIDDRLLAACYDDKTNPYLFRPTYNVFTSNLAKMIADEATRKDPLSVECSYFSDKMAKMEEYQGPFRYNLLRAIRQSVSNTNKTLDTRFDILQYNKQEPKIEKRISLIFGMNWENLGEHYVPEEKSFTTECPGAMFRFLAAQASSMELELTEMKIVSRTDFLRDIKYLLTGVSSILFQFDGANRFQSITNITIEDVRIESIRSLIEQSLEIGTCFRRLHMMTRKNPYTLEMICEGFVFKAFCDSVENFLCGYRVIVNSYTGQSLLQLLQMLSPVNDQLLSLAKLCGLHPNYESDQEFPTGSLLLNHLYRELIEITRPAVSVFLLCILRRCCLEYFAIFQRWLFGGQLHDPSDELFVYFVDHYRSNTKHFFDKAYLIRRHSVPSFLKGYEEDILLCGKYVMLLKAFRPLHPIFTLRQPELNVCLSFDEIAQLQSRWLQYASKARQLCGPAVSVRELYETKQRERNEFYRLVEANFRTYMDQWRVEQETEALEQRRRKQKQMEDLLGHLNEIREKKLIAKRQEMQEELQLEQVRLEMENRQLLRENLELSHRIKKYSDLNSIMDAKLDGLPVSSTELSIVPVVTITTDCATDGASDDGPFESCRESRASTISVSVYEDAQKSPSLSVDCSPYGGDNSGSCSSGTKGDLSSCSVEELDCTIVEGPIIPTVETPQLPLDSDEVNSNVLQDVVMSEGERNRAKVLGSSVGVYLKEDHANANVEQLVVATATAGMRKLTEAQRNKLKILSQEFEITPTVNPNTIDENCNRLEERRKNRERILISDYTTRDVEETGSVESGQAAQELTELQKNRRRIMNQEYNILTDDPDTFGATRRNVKPQMYLNFDSERAKNRRRILDSEFNIATGTENFPVSPMSVDSDTVDDMMSPLTQSAGTPKITINDENDLQNDVNANPVPKKADGLRLNVLAAAEAAERLAIDRRFGIPDTAALETETPASARKSAAKDGLDGAFDFMRTNVFERSEDSVAHPSTSSGSTVEKFERNDEQEDEIYLEFVQALKKQSVNFCRLAIPSSDCNDTELSTVAQKPRLELNSVDVLTITRFLQYSLVIPLKTHMEIVNNEILKMYLYDLDILGHFESLRNYFLFMDGEFSAHICDSLFYRLEAVRTPEELLNYQTLHSILDGALYSSNAGADRNADRLSFIVCQMPEKFDFYTPNVFSMLNLSYRIEWPLNLILTPETIDQYTNVFKYLVKVRRVSYVLEDSFQLLKEASKQLGKPLLHSPQYARVQLIRHKLSHLVNALKNYITSSVLHASWETFREELQDATETMEDLYRKHRAYVKRIVFLCLLNKRSIEFYNNIEQIFRVVLRFYRHLRSKDWHLQASTVSAADATPCETQYYVHPRYEQILADERDFEKLIKYTIYLGNKMYDHGYQKEISEFLHVININGYYDD
ncbi:gamma-tubulin complex component 6 [Anopheles nili]|uniref:gamma-tubulin complex component 6 n=1 Tax=Anopheles nili TaxID=185578 RepID=UPI00237B750E|nr:gamma-tubulin complex component 6 [Anopheles nili]